MVGNLIRAFNAILKRSILEWKSIKMITKDTRLLSFHALRIYIANNNLIGFAKMLEMALTRLFLDINDGFNQLSRNKVPMHRI